MTDPFIKKLRKEIDRADRMLLQALALRARAVLKIGQYKIKNNLPIQNRSRFKEVLTDRLKRSTALGLNPRFIKTIFTLLHSESVRLQNEMKRKNSI